MLELLDPREAANYLQIRNTILDGREFIENVPGRMLLWPSWMKHMVHPYTGGGERISIAYNVNVVEGEARSAQPTRSAGFLRVERARHGRRDCGQSKP